MPRADTQPCPTSLALLASGSSPSPHVVKYWEKPAVIAETTIADISFELRIFLEDVHGEMETTRMPEGPRKSDKAVCQLAA
jgi:hypothetical protein